MTLIRTVALAAWVSLSMQTLALAADRPPLKVIAVQGSSAADASSLDGVVEAVRQTTLSAQVAGAIVALQVKAGDHVKAGQELLRIDARAAQQNLAGSSAQTEAAQASLRVASKELERQKQLLQNSTSARLPMTAPTPNGKPRKPRSKPCRRKPGPRKRSPAFSF